MSGITTHVLDTSLGRPAAGVPVTLEKQDAAGNWRAIGSGTTNADGRITGLTSSDAPLSPGIHRLRFDTGAYFRARGVQGFYPRVTVTFEIRDGAQHYHVPLLLSPYGYSTYRGS